METTISVSKNYYLNSIPNEPSPYTFKMIFRYDSWNRIDSMTYPDGEVVSYGYNLGGMLKSIAGTKMNNAYPYIDSIHYNEFELKKAVYYGNGTKTFYKYDILQRLINLQSYTATTATPSELMQNIDYTYDAVSNITDIDNSAGILANGLGGMYHNRYSYDNLYRLVYSRGNWLGSPNTNYELEMSYNHNGRISRKTLTAGIVTQTPMINSFNSVIYDNMYHYTNTSQPNTLTYIDNNGPQQFFQWDAKGNMTYHKNTAVSLERFLCWDEQNRLQGVRDKSSLSVYQYDANGDRTYKLTGDYTYQNVSGTWRYFYQLDNATLYASPYLVVTSKGYTKHYYAESERIASKLGNGGLQELGHPLADEFQVHDKFLSNTNHAQDVIYECLNAEEVRAYPPLSYLYELTSASQSPENERYFYHPDHLGSSSWITFTDGEAVQHLHYLPYGEDLVNQQHTVVGAMYTFSAKEKDAETGYSYFGSRYYNSDLSIWLSVDPMSDDYPYQSNYVYCSNNPLMIVDPNGMFETRAEAQKYRKEHHTGGSIHKRSKHDNYSGNYSIVNRRTNTSYTKPQHREESSVPTSGMGDDGVVTSAVISSKSLNSDANYTISSSEITSLPSNTNIMSSTATACLLLASDDWTGFGIADNIFIPVVIVAGTAAYGELCFSLMLERNKVPANLNVTDMIGNIIKGASIVRIIRIGERVPMKEKIKVK